MTRRLPDETIPALRDVMRDDGTFLDREFLRWPRIGRGTLARLVELGWIVDVDEPGDRWPRCYQVTPAGRAAMELPQEKTP